MRVEARDGGADSGELVFGATHRAAIEVDNESCFRKEVAVSGGPRLGEDWPTGVEHLPRPRTGQVATIDVQLGDGAMPLNVRANQLGGEMLGLIAGPHDGGQDHLAVEVPGQMSLVAVEEFGLRLATVTHVGVDDGDAPVFGDAAFDAHALAAWVWLEILGDEAFYECERLFERRYGQLVGKGFLEPFA